MEEETAVLPLLYRRRHHHHHRSYTIGQSNVTRSQEGGGVKANSIGWVIHALLDGGRSIVPFSNLTDGRTDGRADH